MTEEEALERIQKSPLNEFIQEEEKILEEELENVNS